MIPQPPIPEPLWSTVPAEAQVAILAVLDSLQGRIAELERKIGQLTMENDFLKKALQHFKDHHRPAVVSGADACSEKSSKPRRKAKP